MLLVKGGVRKVHEQMTAVVGLKNIWIVGGGDLAGQFYDARLLDELIVQSGSVTLGQGKQLFPRRVIEPAFSLSPAYQIGIGVIELRYDVNYAQ